MRIDFIKMHAAGNDYIFIDCMGWELKNPETAARLLSKRHFSVGADGIVLILPSKVAHAKMRIFNADGSEGKMCGNAARCVGKWLYESNFVRKSRITLETESGIRELFLTVRDGKVEKITVDMGNAIPHEMFFLEAGGQKYEMRGVNVGNEHQIAFVPDVDYIDLDRVGSTFEKNPRYSDGVNTELCEIVGKNHLKVRVFERGSGETLACGTGACASAVAGVLCGACDASHPIKISMRGGDLTVFCNETLHVRLLGNAAKTFEGTVEIEI